MGAYFFYTMAFCTIFAAIAALTRIRASISAIWLGVFFLCTAVIFSMLGSPLLAVLQAMSSAVAVVAVIFNTAAVSERGDKRPGRMINFAKVLGALASAYLGFVLIVAIIRPPFVDAPQSGASYEAPSTMGMEVFGKYALSFELVGLLLLTSAIVCGAVLVRGRK